MRSAIAASRGYIWAQAQRRSGTELHRVLTPPNPPPHRLGRRRTAVAVCRRGLDGVLALNVLVEHLDEPHAACKELLRVLSPGSPVVVHAAFMQPLHADPHHYYNATDKVLSAGSRTSTCKPSPFRKTLHPVYTFAWTASELLYDLDGGIARRLRAGHDSMIWRPFGGSEHA